MPANVPKNVTITYVVNFVKTISPGKEVEVKSKTNKYNIKNDTELLLTGWKVEAK